MRFSAVPFVLLLGVALAGCLDGGGGAEPILLPYDREALRYPTTYYFDDGWGLTERLPLADTREQPLGDFYTRWAKGSGFPQWTSAPLADPINVQGNVTLEFWVTSNLVVASTPVIFPDFVVYFGTTDSVLAVVSPNNLKPVGPAGLPPGIGDNSLITMNDAVLVRAVFELPQGGVTVPSGIGLRVVTAPVMMETDASDLIVLYGSEDYPSRVAFNQTFLVDDPADHVVVDHGGSDHTLLAGSFLHGQEVDGVNMLTTTAVVTEHTSGLLVDLDFTGSTPFPDMDLYVFAPDGTPMGLSVTPGSDEAVHLYKRNLEPGGPGLWTVKVVNYVTPSATFTLTVTTLAPPQPGS